MKPFALAGLIPLLWVAGCDRPPTPPPASSAPTPASGPRGANASAQTRGQPDAAGHWEGAITLPGTVLPIRVDLEAAGAGAGAWTGTIDIPLQGLRGFKLGGVTVDGDRVAFTMPGIPGDPTFAGTLTNRTTIAGDFTQGGQTFAFKLERKPRSTALAETPAKGIPGRGLAGFWQGSLKPAPVIELRLVLEITNAPSGAPRGVLISLDQGQSRVPLAALTEASGRVRFETPAAGGSFEGRLSADGSELAGDWTQRGQTLPLAFKRIEQAPVLNRPQEPRPPFPYTSEEVRVTNGAAGVTLAGTLTLPHGAGPHPAVVLLTGSGPQDRDEALMGHRPFLVLADHLTRAGVAVLRCDDRGVGGSSGSLATTTHLDLAADARAMVEFLGARREIDRARLGLVGHSEGGLVAPLVAAQAPEEIAFLVLLAGVGVPFEQLLVRQGMDLARAMGAGDALIARNAASQREVFALLRAEQDDAVVREQLRAAIERQLGELTDTQRRLLGHSEGLVQQQLAAVTTPWFRALLTYDPGATLRQVRCPVLALNGAKDLQVAAKENLGAIALALRAGGNRAVETIEFQNLNHLFQTCETGVPAEYAQIEETIAPVVLDRIARWMRERTTR